MKSQRSVREILDLVLKRKCLVLLVATSVLFVAVVASAFMPRLFESHTKVRVVDNKVVHEMYGRRLAGGGDETERIRAIHEEILSRNSIEGAIAKLDLDAEFAALPERKRRERHEGLIRKLTANTDVDLMETTRGQFIFRIAHTASDPELAQRIVTHLSTGYQNDQFEEAKRTAADALAQIREKIAELDGEYAEAVDALAAFEEAHSEHRFGQPDSTDAQFEKEQDRLHDAEVRIQALELQLENIRAQLAEEPEWLEVEEKLGNELTISRIKEEIRAAEDELVVLRGGYTDQHPKVIAQKLRVDRLQERLAEEEGKTRTVTRKVQNQTHVELKRSEIESLSALTVARRLETDYRERLELLRDRREAFPELQKRWEALKDRRGEIRARIKNTREQEEVAKTTWQTKVAEATMIFDVLDAPILPMRPVSPNRTVILVAGLVLGLALGVAVVMAIDFLDPSFRSSEEVSTALGIPVLGAIARIETMAERDSARRRDRMRLAAVAALLLVIGVAAAMQLDVRVGELLSDTVRTEG